MIKAKDSKAVKLAKKASIYYEQGRFKDALNIAKRSYTLEPSNPLAMWAYGRALYMTDKPTEARKIFRKILKKKSINIAEHTGWKVDEIKDFLCGCRFEIAQCYLQLNCLKPAIKELEECLSIHKRKYDCFFSSKHAKKLLSNLKSIVQARDCKQNRLWISLLEFEKANANNRVKYKKGFTNGIAMGRTEKEALTRMRIMLKEKGFNMLTNEGTEEFELRILKTEIEKELYELAIMASKTSKPLLGTFFMYPSKT